MIEFLLKRYIEDPKHDEIVQVFQYIYGKYHGFECHRALVKIADEVIKPYSKQVEGMNLEEHLDFYRYFWLLDLRQNANDISPADYLPDPTRF